MRVELKLINDNVHKHDTLQSVTSQSLNPSVCRRIFLFLKEDLLNYIDKIGRDHEPEESKAPEKIKKRIRKKGHSCSCKGTKKECDK